MTDESGAEQPNDDRWAAELREKRAEKDEFFAEHPQSPIAPEDREDFDGLDYFEPDDAYSVDATVEVHEEPEPVEMETTAGPPVRYLRVVTFTFELGDEDDEHELHGYRQEHDDSRTLFVPFRDKTTGQQTYEGGRYMELEPEGDLEDAVGTSSDEPSIARALEDGDEVPIDFNLAYTPFCAYSETFSCPLPPEENWLDVAVEAGERAP